jgi:hypothetical protein
MQMEVFLISTNEYSPEEIVKEEIPDKYLYDDEGELSCASAVFSSEEFIHHLLQFLFQGDLPLKKVYKNENSYVLDLSANKKALVDLDYLEENYPVWLKKSGRPNTMNEYGMLIDFIGYARKGLDKKHLLLLVSNREHRS